MAMRKYLLMSKNKLLREQLDLSLMYGNYRTSIKCKR